MNIVAVKTREGEQEMGRKEVGNLNNELLSTWDKEGRIV
jgi:hypothetical protein